MEISQFDTLKPSQNTFTFPPHHRRPLKSATFCTLVRILSNCYDESQRSHALQAVPEEAKLDNGGMELGQVTERDGLVGHNHMESDNLLVQKESLIDEDREVIGFQDRDFSNTQLEIDGLDHSNIMGGNEELSHDNNFNPVNSLGDKKQHSDGVIALSNDHEDQFVIPEFHMDESESIEMLEVEKDRIHEICEAAHSSLDIDMIAGSSKPTENKDRKSYPVERNVLDEVEGEIQWKGRDLEKLLSDSGVMNSSLRLTADEEIEEGEISGDIGNYGELMDFLEDAGSLEEKRVDKMQNSEDIIGNKECTGTEQQRGLENDIESTPLFADTVHNVGNCIVVEHRENNINLEEDKSEMLVHGNTIEAKKADRYGCVIEAGINKNQGSRAKESNSPAARPENLAPRGKPTGENATKNQGTASTKKDAGVHDKKKTRGPSTKEKKKRKKKIRRAEKNRRLGVKRLKLQPVLKPKTVTYCRHYLKGRCQEGEKCKFSHDTIPSTKSMPCCHFARHSCMKGDDCPFDHQLSKYPCNNYLSNGSCSRGADCLFSHEMPVNGVSLVASTVPKPKLKSVSLRVNSNSKNQLNIYGTSHQNVNAKSCSFGISPCKSTEPNVAEAMPKLAAHVTKGSFLSCGKLSLGDTSERKQATSSLKADDDVNVGHLVVQGPLDVVQYPNEIMKRIPAVAPQGISFLSFCKAPLDDSSFEKSSNLPFNGDDGIGKSLLSGSIKGEQAGSSQKRYGGVKVDNKNGQSASGIVRNLNEMARTTSPAVAPRGINFLSFGKAQSDDSSNKKHTSLRANEENAIPPSDQERVCVPNKLHPNAVPWQLPSSSFLCDQSLAHLADGKSKSTPSSSQKSLLSNTPSAMQKALGSTLAFAAKFESEVKMDWSVGAPAVSTDFNKEGGSSENKSMKASTILDFLYSDSSKSKR